MSLCEQIDEESADFQASKVEEPTFNIGENLMVQLNKNKKIKRPVSDDGSESSSHVQLREYYKDIKKLKKMIRLYFQEYKDMKSSTCDFYRIGRVLGRGAFGKVNLACHKVCEHLVAIKSIEKKVLRNEKE